MNRIVLGAVAALLFVSAGLFWWQGRAESEQGAAPPTLTQAPVVGAAPPDSADMRGPAPPEVSAVSREQRRFDRLDRDRDARITANEMLAPRADAFRKLDVDHNNLLTFEEWSVRTANRFKGADADGNGVLMRDEFATTKPKPVKQPECRCAPKRKPSRQARAPKPEPAVVEEESDGDEGEPAV
jgi:hypothetical protein